LLASVSLARRAGPKQEPKNGASRAAGGMRYGGGLPGSGIPAIPVLQKLQRFELVFSGEDKIDGLRRIYL